MGIFGGKEANRVVEAKSVLNRKRSFAQAQCEIRQMKIRADSGHVQSHLSARR